MQESLEKYDNNGTEDEDEDEDFNVEVEETDEET